MRACSGGGFARQGATLAEAAKPCSAAYGGEQSKRFFFEKKNQKIFAPWSPAGRLRQVKNRGKFFGSFFQKRTACLACLP
jgi:hypothetical protein